MKILRFVAAQDVGCAIHPSYVEGQIQGGVTQGIGWALNEEYAWRARYCLRLRFLSARRTSQDARTICAVDCLTRSVLGIKKKRSATLPSRFVETAHDAHVLRAAAIRFGHRLMMDRVVPGGVTTDLTPDGAAQIRNALQEIRRRLPRCGSTAEKSRAATCAIRCGFNGRCWKPTAPADPKRFRKA